MDNNKFLKISVLVCTHNPKREYLEPTIESLKSQSLDYSEWELIIIDNHSSPVVAESYNISWHENGRIIREDELGLTPARLRGIKESKTDLLVFVDDDNILNADYLQNALVIKDEWRQLGAWGGEVVPQFVEKAPDWTKPYWFMLALREAKRDCWSNLYTANETLPCGAGMCVRKEVADAYIKSAKNHPLKVYLDRRGESLVSSGDTDIAYTAIDCGFGMGQFQALSLKHIISPQRLQPEYFLKLWHDMNFSHHLMTFIRNLENPPVLSFKSMVREYVQMLSKNSFDRKMHLSGLRGKKKASRFIRDYEKNYSS